MSFRPDWMDDVLKTLEDARHDIAYSELTLVVNGEPSQAVINYDRNNRSNYTMDKPL